MAADQCRPAALRGQTHAADIPPSPWVERFAAQLVPGSTVLDVAAGSGRHTRFFLARGHRVTAIDRDVAALRALADDEPRLELIAADLETAAGWPLERRRFDGVVVTNYLHRPILSDIIAAVVPGGLLIYETFARGNERFGKPSNPAFLLEPGELLEAVRGRLRVLAYEDIEVSEPRPAMVQRLAARAGM